MQPELYQKSHFNEVEMSPANPFFLPDLSALIGILKRYLDESTKRLPHFYIALNA
jgi:hypothetical protein